MKTRQIKTRQLHHKLRIIRTGLGAVILAMLGMRAYAAENVLNFSAKTDRVATPARITTVDFTLEAWVRMTAQQPENQILSQYIGGNPGRMIFALREDKPAFFVAGWLEGKPVDFANKWHTSQQLAAARHGRSMSTAS